MKNPSELSQFRTLYTKAKIAREKKMKNQMQITYIERIIKTHKNIYTNIYTYRGFRVDEPCLEASLRFRSEYP